MPVRRPNPPARPAARRPPVRRPNGARQSGPAQRMRGKSNAANKVQSGVGISKAAAGGYVSPNIASDTPVSASFGGYDQGTTMERIARNEWLNTLDVETRARAMNKMGYWTGGQQVRAPQLSKSDINYYKNAARDVLKRFPDSAYQPTAANGAFIGTFKLVNGKVVYTPSNNAGKGKGKGKGKGRGNGAGRGGAGGGNGGGSGSGGIPDGPGGDVAVGAGESAGTTGESFTTGVSGKTGEFITEKGGSGPKGEQADTGRTSDKRKRRKAQTKKLVKRATKKTDVKAKTIRKALRSPGVTASDKKVYAKVARQASPKLSARLRARDRAKKR